MIIVVRPSLRAVAVRARFRGGAVGWWPGRGRAYGIHVRSVSAECLGTRRCRQRWLGMPMPKQPNGSPGKKPAALNAAHGDCLAKLWCGPGPPAQGEITAKGRGPRSAGMR